MVAVTDGRGVGVADTGVAVADAGVEVADAVVEAGAPARPVGGAVRKSAVERHEGLGLRPCFSASVANIAGWRFCSGQLPSIQGLSEQHPWKVGLVFPPQVHHRLPTGQAT